jgi:hypothetical protein
VTLRRRNKPPITCKFYILTYIFDSERSRNTCHTYLARHPVDIKSIQLEVLSLSTSLSSLETDPFCRADKSPRHTIHNDHALKVYCVP